MTRLTILVSHPIQYLIPLFQALAEKEALDTEIWFNNDFGDKPFFDPDFKTVIKWDIDLHRGYKSRLLKNISLSPSTRLFGQINPGIVSLLFSRNRPQVIVIWGWNSITNLATIVLARILGVRLYLRAETTIDYETRIPFAKRVFKKLLLRQLFRMFDGFLYLGHQNRQFYKYMGINDEQLHFMPYCVHRIPSELSTRRLTSIRRFIFVGKLTYKKRPDIVLEAFELMRRKCPEAGVELTIVGDGDMRDLVLEKSKLDPAINFHGFANQSELKSIYQKHDAAILASDERETWGLVINEALVNGLAVIVSDRVGCREDLIKPGKNGAIFKYGDAAELAEYMMAMVDGKFNLREIKETNRQLASVYNHDTGATTLANLSNV
jgi:glycosyltransferase involved in cell wall biosynthesis